VRGRRHPILLTVAIAVGIVALAAIPIDLARWRETHRVEEAFKEQTRTHQRALSAQARDSMEPYAVGSLVDFPSSPVADGFRFVAMPSFSGPWYSLTLQPNASGAVDGSLVVIQVAADRPMDLRPKRGPARRFHMPRPAYDAMTQRIDDLAVVSKKVVHTLPGCEAADA
jgi:hypothetical protein